MKKTVLSLFAAAAFCSLPANDNLAAGAKATASSVEKPEYPAANAVDGNQKSRWSSNRADGEWLLLDLGEAKTVGCVQLDWEAAAGKEYIIQFSKDGETFTDVATVKDGQKDESRIVNFKPQETRFIRIQGVKRATQHGYSLWEVKAYAEPANLAYGAAVTASSVERKDCPAEAVADGNRNTRWSSNRNDNEQITLKLAKEQTVGKIVLRWEQAAGKEYAVEFSEDGTNFTEVFRKTDGKSGAVETIVIEPRKTNFIRIQGIKRATQYGYSLWEVEAYAK